MKRFVMGSVAGLVLALSLGLSACGMFSPPHKPAIVILSPLPGTPIREGDTVTIQSAATDPSGITRVELAVDGTVVRADAPPATENSFTVAQTWQAIAGSHNLSVRAFNSSGATSDPATFQVAVTPGIAAAPSLTPSKAPTLGPSPSNASCTDAAVFIADVTIPDGAVLFAQQTFDKVWRVRNTGTCTWGKGYQFVLLSGQVMAATPVPVPATATGTTADLIVPMTAPATLGSFNSVWRLRNPAGVLFGDTLNASIRVVPASTPATCSGTPNIEFFNASPTTITAGQSATLTWGFVSNAESASIDNGIGGVATPGSVAVSPAGTATYILTATCGTLTRTAQVTINVIPTSTIPAPTPTHPATPVNTPSPSATPHATFIPPTPTNTPTP
ncbi:MAG TPA: NBR1-Ig-like domain-containing protein [Anaerolineae bacterium]